MNFFALFSIVYFSNISLKSETGINCSGKEIVHTAVEIFPAFYLHKNVSLALVVKMRRQEGKERCNRVATL